MSLELLSYMYTRLNYSRVYIIQFHISGITQLQYTRFNYSRCIWNYTFTCIWNYKITCILAIITHEYTLYNFIYLELHNYSILALITHDVFGITHLHVSGITQLHVSGITQLHHERGVSKKIVHWRCIFLTTIDIEMILGDLQL